jgi:purine-cytosine permease-like protein
VSEQNEAPRKPRRVSIGRFSVRVPQSRTWRIILGIALVLGGLVGFLPILGFWMIPLGLIVLSIDFHPIRRLRRRFQIWWARRKQKKS